jgi:hypothetical protein
VSLGLGTRCAFAELSAMPEPQLIIRKSGGVPEPAYAIASASCALQRSGSADPLRYRFAWKGAVWRDTAPGMSAENVQTVHEAVEFFNRRQMWVDFLDPEVESRLAVRGLPRCTGTSAFHAGPSLSSVIRGVLATRFKTDHW